MHKPSAVYFMKKKVCLYVSTTLSNSHRRGSVAENKHLLRLKAVLQENDNNQHGLGLDQNNQMKELKKSLTEPNGKIDWGKQKKKSWNTELSCCTKFGRGAWWGVRVGGAYKDAEQHMTLFLKHCTSGALLHFTRPLPSFLPHFVPLSISPGATLSPPPKSSRPHRLAVMFIFLLGPAHHNGRLCWPIWPSPSSSWAWSCLCASLINIKKQIAAG